MAETNEHRRPTKEEQGNKGSASTFRGEVAEPIATRLGHGLLIYDLAGLLFVATRRKEE